MSFKPMNEHTLLMRYGRVGSKKRRRRDEKLLKLFASRCGRDVVGQVHWVPLKWVHELDEKVDHLHKDMKEKFKEPNPDNMLGYWPLQGEWLIWWGQWKAWVIAHQSEWSRTGEEAETSFYHYRSQYNEFLRRFKEAGGKTTATESKGGVEPFGKGEGLSFGTGISVGLVLAGAVVVAAFFWLKD